MLKKILIVLIFVFFTLLFTYPSVLNLSSKIIGDGHDSSLVMGWQYIAKNQINGGNYPFSWTNYWRYPVGFDLSKSYDSTAFVFLGIFLYGIFKSPVLVFNLSVLIITTLNGLFSFVFFKKISKNYVLGILGALVYGYSFYLLARLGGHMNLIFIGCFPFFAYSFINLLDNKGRNKSVYIFILAFLLVLLSSLQYFLILIASLLITIPLLCVVYPNIFLSLRKIVIVNYKEFILGFFVLLCIFLILYLQVLIFFFFRNMVTMPLGYSAAVSPHIIDFFRYGNYLNLINRVIPFLKTKVGTIENTVFLGYVEILAFIFFLASKVPKNLKIFVAAGVTVFLVLSLGCQSKFYPYCFVYGSYPFSGIAETGRYYVVLYLFVTSALILLLKSFNKIKVVTIVLVSALIIFERFPVGFYLSPVPNDQPFIKVVKNLDSKAVLDLPIVSQNSSSSLKMNYDLYSIFYEKPIVNGYIQWMGQTYQSQSFLGNFASLTCGTKSFAIIQEDESMANILKHEGIYTIVLHKPTPDADLNNAECDLAYKNISIFLYSSHIKIRVVYDDKNVTVFQLM